MIFWLILIFVSILIMIFLQFKKVIKFPDRKEAKIKKDKKINEKRKKEMEKEVENSSINAADDFMNRKEYLFLKFLNSILPKDYFAVPKVSACSIIKPSGDKNLYNRLLEFNLDFVIFNSQTFKVELIIDIYDKTYNDDRMQESFPVLYEAVKKVNFKMIHILVAGDFDIETTEKEILKQLGIVVDKEVDEDLTNGSIDTN